MKKNSILVLIIVSLFILAFILIRSTRLNDNANIIYTANEPISSKLRKAVESVSYPTQARPVGMFTKVELSSKQPLNELITLVGDSNVDLVLGINRIDRGNIRPGMTIVVPKDINTIKKWEYLPGKIGTAKSIPKLIIVSQPIQAFGAYEYGLLVHSGPVSSGKKLNQTPSGLFFVNWKGEETISTFDDEWILKWNMNIDNLAGISMHQYSLPGYPASHSCVRMTEADAYWMYKWTEEWTWKNGEVITEGTPVVVYNNYNFDGPAPWTLLPENSKSTDTPRSILEDLVKNYLPKIKSST